MKHYLILTAIVMLAGAAGAQPREITGLPSGGPVTIDGTLDEACWSTGDWSTNFSFLDMPEHSPEVQTRFKVRFDEQAVYVGIEAEEPSPETMLLQSATRDLKVWNDDCVEIMLDPTGERVEYYHIMVNGLGTVYDAQMRQGGNVRSVDWDCTVEAATQIGTTAWTAEFRLPLVELGLNASSAGAWALNVTRTRRAQGTELSSFSPLTGGFHQPTLYASLSMQGGDFGRFLWDIKPPYEARVLPEDGGLVYTAKIHCRNAGSVFQFIRVRGRLDGSDGEWVNDGLDRNQGREYTIRVPLARQGMQPLVLELADRQTGAPLSIRRYQVDLSYTPIQLDVTRPWYRNSIYATETIDSIACTAALALPEDTRASLRLRAALRRAGQNAAAPVAEKLIATLPETVAISLPIPDLQVGDYTLHVTLENPVDGKVVHAAETPIHKLPEVAEEWRFDERNVLLHNGAEVLPFGWFSIPLQAMTEGGHAYRLIQNYTAQYKRTREEARAWLDEVRAADTHCTIYPYPGSAMMTPATVWGKPLSETEAEALRRRLLDIADHPGIFAWYLADEPELRPALPARLRAIYEVCRTTDPYHPCIMLNDTIAGIFKYVDSGDILMPDPYPCFIKGGLAAQPIEKTSNFIKACQEAGQGRKAIWITPQAFNYGDYGRKNQRGPNAVELRNQLYQAVVYGAKGFLWYTYAHTANYADLDLGMRWLSFEVADLKAPILANPAEQVTVSVKAPLPDHVHVSPRMVQGQLTIFAVNTATVPQDITLTLQGEALPGMDANAPLFVVSEQRQLQADANGTIHDHFGTYETHIYSTDPALGKRVTFADLRRRIATADAARRRPGNLAFEEHGTRVEVSSKARYGSTPDRVIDGIHDGMAWRADTAAKDAHWLTLAWPEPQRLGRAIIYSSTIAACDIQIPDGDGWKTLAGITDNAEDRIDIAFPQVTTQTLRVLITDTRPDTRGAIVWEVEAYVK